MVRIVQAVQTSSKYTPTNIMTTLETTSITIARAGSNDRRDAPTHRRLFASALLSGQDRYSGDQHRSRRDGRYADQSPGPLPAQTYSGKSDHSAGIHGRRRRAQSGKPSVPQRPRRRLDHRRDKQQRGVAQHHARERRELRYRQVHLPRRSRKCRPPNHLYAGKSSG